MPFCERREDHAADVLALLEGEDVLLGFVRPGARGGLVVHVLVFEIFDVQVGAEALEVPANDRAVRSRGLDARGPAPRGRGGLRLSDAADRRGIYGTPRRYVSFRRPVAAGAWRKTYVARSAAASTHAACHFRKSGDA